MISWLRRHRGFIWKSVIVSMLVSLVSAGGYYFTNKDHGDAVLTVGKVKVPFSLYQRLVDDTLERLRKNKREVTEEMVKEIRFEALRTLLTDEVAAAAAGEIGVAVSDEELAQAIRQNPQFQTDKAFNQALYLQIVQQVYNSTVEDYEARVRRQFAALKYQELIFDSVKLVPDEIREEYKRSHEGSDKNFVKDKDAFARNLYQIRARYALSSALNQMSKRLEIHDYSQLQSPGA